MTQYNNLTLEVKDYQITNAETIIETINSEENYERLKEYYDVLKNNIGYNNYENFSSIIKALELRIKFLTSGSIEENHVLDDLLNIYVTLEDVYPLIKTYLNKLPLQASEKLKLYAYLSDAITILTTLEKDIFDETENNFENEAIKSIIDFIEHKERNEYEQALLEKFYNYLDKINSTSKGVSNERRKSYGISSNPAPLLLDYNGASLTIIIITITVLLGAVIAALLLVK